MAQQGWTAGPAPETSAWAPGPIPTTPTFRQTDTTPNEMDPNTLGTFTSHVATQLNPIPAGQLLPFPKSLGGAGWDAPIQAGKHLLEAQGAVFDRAKEAYAKGDVASAAIHALHWLLPVIGPMLDKAGIELKEGKYAAGLGDTVGLAGALVAPEAIAAARQTSGAVAVAKKAGTAADTRFADVMTPKGSSRATLRMGKQAEAIAEDVRQGTTAITPTGLHVQVADRLSSATDALDQAYQAVPKVGYSTNPLKTKLQSALDALKVKGSSGAVVPAAVADRAAALQTAIKEVDAIGPYTNTANLAQLRNNWGQAAKDAFVPNLNPNFQQIRGSAKGWADAWSALQDTLTERHPELKPLNADFHVWKQAADVMQALQDQQRVKPTVGRTIMARTGGAAAGAALGGGGGMVAGEIVGPLVERGLTQTISPSMKLLIARNLGNLADAIRSNQTARIGIILKSLRPLLLTNVIPRASAAAPTLTPALAGAGQP